MMERAHVKLPSTGKIVQAKVLRKRKSRYGGQKVEVSYAELPPFWAYPLSVEDIEEIEQAAEAIAEDGL